MKYYVCLLGLGDNLISLSFLKQVDGKVNIIGTKYTKEIAKLIESEDKFDIKVLFDDVPAFYDIRKKGVIKAVKDFWVFVKYIKKSKISEIVFEKNDFRSLLATLLTGVKSFLPPKQGNVYINRKKSIEYAYEKAIMLNEYPLKLYNPRKILINPLTRLRQKNIKPEHLEIIIEELNENGYEIYLIDLEKGYSTFKDKVSSYLTNTSLYDVKQLMQMCDLYIGGDSFLIHLACFLKRNYFIIFYRDNYDFLPPNATEDFYIKAHRCYNFRDTIRQKFKNIGLIK